MAGKGLPSTSFQVGINKVVDAGIHRLDGETAPAGNAGRWDYNRRVGARLGL